MLLMMYICTVFTSIYHILLILVHLQIILGVSYSLEVDIKFFLHGLDLTMSTKLYFIQTDFALIEWLCQC